MQGEGWCKKARVINELTKLTSECTDAGQRKRRDAKTVRSPSFFATPIHKIGYCTRKVRSLKSLRRMPECCVHPYTRKAVLDAIKICCAEFHFCV
eukprot:GFUD01074963.1.p1 GENE.GFUD01074963.1~~GFUD01074963.1.p1  ORF type:complete len:103 (+),score=17.82 GFUD01074963.1:26-310(+)